MSDLITLNLAGNELSKKRDWFDARDELGRQAQKITAIETTETFHMASALQSVMKKHIKKLGNHRLEITRQIDALKKQFMDQEKEFVKPLQTELNKVQKLADVYATEIRKKEEEAEKKREQDERDRIQKEVDEQEKKDAEFREMFGTEATTDAALEPPPIVAPITTFSAPKLKAASNAKLADVWDFEIVDPLKVPREYLVVDESKIRAYKDLQVKLKKEPQLDGVRFTKSTKVQSR